jgi:hypothetical protein
MLIPLVLWNLVLLLVAILISILYWGYDETKHWKHRHFNRPGPHQLYIHRLLTLLPSTGLLF